MRTVNIGDSVMLSPFGIEMQAGKFSKKKGIVVDEQKHGTTDYIVAVKWEGIKTPKWIHEHQLIQI